jgi:hypothetical protein
MTGMAFVHSVAEFLGWPFDNGFEDWDKVALEGLLVRIFDAG